MAYPEPLIIPPQQEHKHSFILLHGRGSNGPEFGLEFLRSKTSNGETLQSIFPSLKSIFPTASKRRAKSYNRAKIHQWFDNVPLEDQDARGRITREEEEWQISGLKDSYAFLRGIVDAEIEAVGARNIYIGGLSQGCATSLFFLLSYEGSERLGGFIGMSGWLPFRADIDRAKSTTSLDLEGKSNPFSSEEQEKHQEMAKEASNLVRDIVDLQPIDASRPLFLDTPVFLGHGQRDEKVKLTRGWQAATCLRELEVDVTWKEYNEGHWYKVPEEIDDIVEFLREHMAKEDPEVR